MLWGSIESGENMHTIQEASPATSGMSESDREKVREQLDRLLETHHFKNSRRYPPLLRFIVEETLEGRGEYLKERLLGVQVFNRPADYDTASDPIVRVTIAEIRKRIAQYYHDEEHDEEIRIDLLPGRYAPEFRTRASRIEVGPDGAVATESSHVQAAKVISTPALLSASPSSPLPQGRFAGARSRKVFYVASVAAVLLLTVVYRPVMRWMKPTALDQLWEPLLGSERPVLFCVPTDVGKKRDEMGNPKVVDPVPAGGEVRAANAAGPTFLDHESLGENIVYSDMLAALSIANVMAIHRREYRVRLNVSTTLEDLRQGPNVLIGGLDNQWTMRALAGLRFHFAGSDEDRYWIRDLNNLGNKEWSLDLKQIYGKVDRDYAIIARIHNDQTGEPQMIIAGIGMSGTAAAGEFIGNEGRVEELRHRIGPGFKDHDFEAVLSTDVVNGIGGSPKILAVSVW